VISIAKRRNEMTKKLVLSSLISKSVLSFAALLLIVMSIVFIPTNAKAESNEKAVMTAENAETQATVGYGLKFIGAGIAVGLGSIAGGIAVAGVGSAAMGAVVERPELMGRSLIYVGLAEGIAIYGMVVAIMILIA